MKQILCFGDSNTWGYDGESRERLPFKVRWTGRLQKAYEGKDVRIIEEGLCGRTTVFEDSFRQGRKGTALLPTLLETHHPVDLVVLMLGTNDCKTIFGASAEVIGRGIQCLLDQIQTFAPQADVLLISPIYLGEKVWQEGYDQDFSPQSVQVSKELETVYERIVAERQIGYLRASDYVQCCEADQEHLNAQGHQIFAQAVYEKTERMLWQRSGWRRVV
ncbi:MAG: GDSL-type esterase/lipase family protein [Lachnospiraceae bacterium]